MDDYLYWHNQGWVADRASRVDGADVDVQITYALHVALSPGLLEAFAASWTREGHRAALTLVLRANLGNS